MVSEDKLLFFLKLQKFILEVEDLNILVPNLLIKIFKEASEINAQYIFVAAFFIDEANRLKQQYFYDQQQTKSLVLKPQSLFVLGSKWENELIWGHIYATSEVGELVDQSYSQFSMLGSLVISPIHLNKKLAGAVIFGISNENQTSAVLSAENELVYQILSNLISSAYRLQDIQTSLTQVTQEVYKVNLQLHQLDKLKDDFVSVASHELRTPMTAIRSYAWMALNRPDVPLSDKLKRYLSRTLLSTERLINLVNDMLNISRIESGRVEILPKVFDIKTLVADVMNEVFARAKERNLNLRVEHTQVPQVFADPDKVHQVLLNLVGNALKFTPVNGAVTVSFFSDGKVVEISVKDSGVGIAKEDLPRLFKKFGRLDNSYVAIATSEGTGLGLYISKSLIELMKGTIIVRSEGVGKGATFTFSLPAATEEVLKEADKYTIKAKGEAKLLEPAAV
ncbi:HAMP domain-containing histidine kinase [Candidatus Daviesbacteria bacterium]|nr:HAMP domain-containing histidine kinase [Candidatus Daviesbacteria bacterium]